MPELLGFKVKDGEVVAMINYPNARKFILQPKAQPTDKQKQQTNGDDNGSSHETR